LTLSDFVGDGAVVYVYCWFVRAVVFPLFGGLLLEVRR
jgi:hypothetical protein